jgi:anti-anti-sigma factor
MNGTECKNIFTAIIDPGLDGEPAELVRGQEQSLLERLKPLVRQQSVVLDLRHVERIDAAGIAALITLYCTAHQAEHEFLVSHAGPRVEEILNLVGMNRLLVSASEENKEDSADYGVPLELARV